MEMVTMRPVDYDSKEKEEIKLIRAMSLKKGRNYDEAISIAEEEEEEEEEPTCSKRRKLGNLKLKTTFSFKNMITENCGGDGSKEQVVNSVFNRENISPTIIRPIGELDVAAIKLQKVYKSYRTRRNLADCAVVCEELWWDFASLSRCSTSRFESDKSETAISKWARARTMAAKVGKGLCKDDKAQKLALRHWLEAIDPRHRYGHNLHLYYDVWFHSQSSQPFFYWLDVGDGKEVNLEKCPRSELHRQCVKYLGPKEREAYEVTVEKGRLVYKKCHDPVHTTEGSKWIFVLSSSRILYVGEKKKGQFHHSSFLAGGATISSGRLVAHRGILNAIWPYSGHYRPTEKNFMEFIGFLTEHNVDMANVKKHAIDDDVVPSKHDVEHEHESKKDSVIANDCNNNQEIVGHFGNSNVEDSQFKEGKPLSSKWSSGFGPRIGCVREYPTNLQVKALEQLNLSPRIFNHAKFPSNKAPIPSPRPSPKVHLSPSLIQMGLPSPRLHVTPTN